MASLGQDDLRVLEQTRQRLLALSTSINALHQDLLTEQPLPSWSALQSHSSLISNNLQTIAQQLVEHQSLLSSLVTYPLPQFPGRTQGPILEQMLRVKLEPDVQEWMERGQTWAGDLSKRTGAGLSKKDREELWQWAPGAANIEARKQKWGADYTRAEKQAGIENVATGLTRELAEPPDDLNEEEDEEVEEVTDDDDNDDDDDDDDEQGDKMDIVEVPAKSKQPAPNTKASKKPVAPEMPLETIHKFMSTGKM